MHGQKQQCQDLFESYRKYHINNKHQDIAIIYWLKEIKETVVFLNREEPQISTATKEIFLTSNKISMSTTHQPNKKNQSTKIKKSQKGS